MLTQAINLIPSAKSSQTSSKSSDKLNVSFGTVMSQSVNAKRLDKTQSNLNGHSESKNDISKNSKEDGLTTETIKNSPKNHPQVTDGLDVSANKQDVASKEEVSPELMEQAIASMQSVIQNVVTEVLGISKEELNSFMEELGLQPVDLLEPTNAMKLMMKVSDILEPMQLLTDDALSNQLKQLTGMLDELSIPKEFNLTKEEIKLAMEQNPQEMNLDSEMNDTKEDVQKFDKTSPQIVVEKSTEDKADTLTKAAENDEIPHVVEKEPLSKENSLSEHQQRNESESKEQKAPVETFIENLAIKGQTQTMTVDAVTERIDTMRNIVEQVVEQIKVQIKPEATSMELQLNPQNLGKINLSVAMKNGQMTATITTQNETAKAALESQMQVLKDNLSSQGLKVEAVEVNVSNFQFSFNQNNQMGSGENQQKRQNNRRKIDLSDFDEHSTDVTDEEILASKVMRQNGGSVDYTA